LKAYLPEKEFEEVRRILYGNKSETLNLPDSAKAIAEKYNFELAGYKIPALKEQLRPPRIVRIGAI
jgi:beta-ureidopropionase